MQCDIDLYKLLSGVPTVFIVDYDDIRIMSAWWDGINIHIECFTQSAINEYRHNRDVGLIDPIIINFNKFNETIEYLSLNKNIQTKPLFYDDDDKRSSIISLMVKDLRS